MYYRKLGKTGLKVSVLSLGSWLTFANKLNVKKAAIMMQNASDLGVNFFDNAEVYAGGEAEQVMGDALKLIRLPRDSFIISSKVYWGGHLPTQSGLSRKHITDACNNSLSRLRTDYIDLYFCHRQDPDTSMEEIVFTMDSLIRQGKILYWGTSEWEAQRIIEAIVIAKQNHLIPPVTEQFQYNMFERSKGEKEFNYLFSEYGYGATTSMPLACGILTGKYNNGIPKGSRADDLKSDWFRAIINSADGQQKIEKVKQLNEIANSVGISMVNLAILWCIRNERVSSVILGVSDSEQLDENIKSLEYIKKIDDEISSSVELILKNRPTINCELTYNQILSMV